MNGRPREEDDDRPTMVAKDDDLEVFDDVEMQKLVDRTWRISRDDNIPPFRYTSTMVYI